MPLLMPTFPTSEVFEYETELDAVACRLRFAWRARPGAWYIDLLGVQGERLISGKRLSPGSLPFGRTPHLPGLMIVTGPDPYAQADLGASLQLVYLTVLDLLEVTP